jgi:hypothetical protein
VGAGLSSPLQAGEDPGSAVIAFRWPAAIVAGQPLSPDGVSEHIEKLANVGLVPWGTHLSDSTDA